MEKTQNKGKTPNIKAQNKETKERKIMKVMIDRLTQNDKGKKDKGYIKLEDLCIKLSQAPTSYED